MPILHLDFETRSALNLNRVSTWRYAGDKTTEVLCAAYAVDDRPVGLWTPGAPIPDEITESAADPTARIAAHNAAFEFLIWGRLLTPRVNWPTISIDRFTCTMAMARAAALPGSLDGAAAALGLAVRKDKAGAKLMKEIATRKREPTPEDRDRLHAYCRQDVEVERALFHRLPKLTEAERALWLLDQEINARGLPIDRELAVAVADLAKEQRLFVNNEIAALTGGKVTTANQRDRIIEFLSADGCEIEGLTKADVKKALGGNASENVRKLLELRAVGSQAAASKVDTLLTGLDSDDRLRETLVYHGAATGRWSGRRFQPQNLRKPAKTLDVVAAIAAIKSGDLARIEGLGTPLSIAADVSRGLICARPGYVLVGADLSAIESRILAWLAGEKWKLQSYAEYDQTADPALEPYCQTASKILNRAVTADDEEGRAVGKVADLACGYGGGVSAWKRFAAKDTRDDAAIKADVGRWRKAHPRIVRFWTDLENALKRAVRRPGKRFECSRLSAECRDGTLRMYLPSGRSISYPEARLVPGKFEDTTAIAFKDNAMGKWMDVTGWYGTFVENAVQATARDVLAAALMRVEATGFNPIAHVHDEAICEIPEGEDRRKKFLAVMTASPPWADGLPLAGKAWQGTRFIKSDKPAPAPTAELAAEKIPAPPPKSEAAGVIEAVIEEIRTAPEAAEIPIQPSESEPVLDFTVPWEGEDGGDRQHSEATDDEMTAEACKDGYAADHKGDAGKPYAPVRARLLERGYKLVKSFWFMLPGEPEPVFFEDRYEKPAKGGKKVKQCRFRHVKDGVELCDTGPRRILYGLPGLVKAGLSTPVFITEGAAKCEPLIAAGLVAVAAPYHTFKDECATALAGRSLIYLEDHDLPDASGQSAAKKFSDLARRQLGPMAASVRIVPAIILWKDLGRAGAPPHGWDVKDWVDAGGKPALLSEICKAEPEAEAIDPVDLWGQFDPPTLPRGLLPPMIEQFALEEADLMGADPCGLAASALAVCAAALPDHTKLQVKRYDPNWLEEARLWIGLIGNPSTKKSPVMRRAVKPFNKIDAALYRDYLATAEAYEHLSKDEQKKNPRPKQNQLRLEDVTIEAAQEVLKGSTEGVLCYQDELFGWFGSMDKYTGRGGMKDRAFWLSAFNGGTYAVNRVQRGSALIENLSISLLGGIQPEPIRQVAADTVDDGLLQRLIPIVLRSGKAGKDAPTSHAGGRYDKLIESLHSRQPPPAPLQFDDGALAIRKALEQKHLDLMACEIVNKKLAAHIGKYDGLFARMCLLWHCIEDAPGLTIPERTARRVADFMHQFLLPHAAAFYAGVLELSDDHERLTKLAGHILAKKLERVTNRDVHAGVHSMRNLGKQQTESIFQQLEAFGWLIQETDARRGRSPRWLVNPEVHRRFRERAEREVVERKRRQEAIREMAQTRTKGAIDGHWQSKCG
jgi:hypothetical protein